MASLNTNSVATELVVVTVSYGSDSALPSFVESLSGASSRPLSLIVVDNQPMSGDVCNITRSAGGIYIAQPANPGYGSAMNAGVRNLPSTVKWLLLSNPDVMFGQGSIDALVRAGEADPRIGAVGPALMTDGRVYPSARSVPSLRNGVGHALFANLWLSNPWSRAYKNAYGNDAGTRDAGWLSGACVLVRRAAFDEIGGFDPGYFMYFEDVDLGYRLGKANYRNVYEPAGIVIHTGAHSTGRASAQMVRAHHASARRFLSKKYAGPLLAPIRLALALGLRIRSRLIVKRLTSGRL